MRLARPLFAVRDRVTAPESPWSPVERLVALALADHMDADGVCWPSQRALATWTGLGLRAVQAALARLTAPAGLFDEETGGSRRGERRSVSRYRLRTVAPRAAVTIAPDATVRGSTVAPRAARPSHHVRPEGTNEGNNNGAAVAAGREHVANVPAKRSDELAEAAACRTTCGEYAALTGRPLDEILWEFSEFKGRRLVRLDTAPLGWLRVTHDRVRAALISERKDRASKRPAPEPTGPVFVGPRKLA